MGNPGRHDNPNYLAPLNMAPGKYDPGDTRKPQRRYMPAYSQHVTVARVTRAEGFRSRRGVRPKRGAGKRQNPCG